MIDYKTIGEQIGWHYDGLQTWEGIGRLRAFSKRTEPNHPAYGATFYVLEQATEEQIRTKAKEKEREFIDSARNLK